MSSSALASARKRRSGVESAPPPPSAIPGRPGQPPMPGQPGTGLTIQQVIALVDKRLLILESFMKETQTAPQTQTDTQSQTQVLPDIPTNIKELLEEYGSRFDIIADELASIKNMLLSLQSFTMDVNKKLMDERIRILSAEDEAVPTPLERELELEQSA